MTTEECALELIHDGNIVGLGSGQSASAFVHALAAQVARGLDIRGVATSETTAVLATRLGIPLTTLDRVETVDITVDGADEVDPALDMIKGRGGALVREKIVAASSKRLVILVGEEKLVPALGARGSLPVEVVPFGLTLCLRRLQALGYAGELRMHDGKPFRTDNGNCIVDCRIGVLRDPLALERALLAIPGVIETGLFLGMADTVFVQSGNDVRTQARR
jgi:ribose 5-phosphate isomerase A